MDSVCYVDEMGRKIFTQCVYVKYNVYPNTRACEQFTAMKGKSREEQFSKLLTSLIPKK